MYTYAHITTDRLGDDTSAWSGVYLQDDSHPTSVTDMWQSPHPSSRSDQFSSIVPVRTGYHHPLNRAHQSSSRDVVKKKEQMKPWHQIQSTGVCIQKFSSWAKETSIGYPDCSFLLKLHVMWSPIENIITQGECSLHGISLAPLIPVVATLSLQEKWQRWREACSLYHQHIQRHPLAATQSQMHTQ